MSLQQNQFKEHVEITPNLQNRDPNFYSLVYRTSMLYGLYYSVIRLCTLQCVNLGAKKDFKRGTIGCNFKLAFQTYFHYVVITLIIVIFFISTATGICHIYQMQSFTII